jgi:putative membrane-bound dehydrogenase-like protein
MTALIQRMIRVLPIWLMATSACLGADDTSGSTTVTVDRGSSQRLRTQVVALNGQSFTLPVGFEIEVAASPELAPRPITADFDEQGRLYVADSTGTNEDVEQQIKHPPHRIVRLEDTKRDGRFDKSSVFADHVMFPEGTMWRDGSLYVAAPPSIWKLTDTTGRGVADQRVEWFQGKTLTHCANDLHGPYLGPDGWIYWCKGAFARQVYERPGQSPFITRAAHIFRCRPDGSGLEPVMTGGMDNPVAVVFMPNGERIFTTTFFQHPALGLRDGLIHDVYGAVYGKLHDVILDHPWTGPTVMPVLTHMGAAAPCGLVRYESTAFGPEYANNLFACQFNMHKVSRHVLTPQGATYASRDEDFLVSENHDFHPTDVMEDADGSLLVVDTGGWYKICCPTSQLQKSDVLGAIYRVRRKDAPRPEDPRGLAIKWSSLSASDLAALLDDARPAVRRRAIETLAAKGNDALVAIRGVLIGSGIRENSDAPRGAGHGILTNSATARRNAVWTLARIEQPEARALVRAALADKDDGVRQAALNVISLWRDRGAVPDLLHVLESDSAFNRRVAAEALGRAGDSAAVGPLLKAAERPMDRFEHHAICYALIELNDPQAIKHEGLSSDNPQVLRAALVALDQMPGGNLAAVQIVRRLKTTDPELKETLLWIAGRHPEWGDQLAGYFREQLASRGTPPGATGKRSLPVPASPETQELESLLSRLATSQAIQSLVADDLASGTTPIVTKRLLLGVIDHSGLQQLPERWIATLAALLDSGPPDLRLEAIRVVRETTSSRSPIEPLGAALSRIAADESLSDGTRLAALGAIPGGTGELGNELFAYTLRFLDDHASSTEHNAAIEALARAKLTKSQFLSLAHALPRLAPVEVDRLLESFQRTTHEEVGLAVAEALGAYPSLTSLRVDMIKPRLAKYPPAVRKAAESLYPRINVDLAEQAKKLERIIQELPAGEIRRGQAVFQSAKAACTSCHAIGYLGGRVGPDLTRIATIRTRRDLVESIVLPSASIVRSYEPILVETRSGLTYNGLIKHETASEIELVVGPDRTVRIARGDIEETRPSKISIMPAGFDQILSRQELADLLAFLETCK